MNNTVNVLDMPIVKSIIASAEFKIKKLTGSDVTLIPGPVGGYSTKNKKLILQSCIADFFEINWKDVIIKSRKTDLIKARKFYSWCSVKILRQTLVATGDDLGGRDHGTILNALCRCKDAINKKNAFALDLEKFISIFNTLILEEYNG